MSTLITEAADAHTPCPECGAKPQRSMTHGTTEYRIWHVSTCYTGGYTDPTLVDPEYPERGYEHPAWGLARANTASSTGSVLFDSDIKHSRVVTLTIAQASRHRTLHRDWIHPVRDIIEIQMSQAQWGALVSSFGDGSGVPVTITKTDHGYVAPVPYEPRLAESISEVRNAATTGVEPITNAYQAVMDAFEAGAGKKAMRDALTSLGHQIGNAPSNMEFAAKSLVEHAENVVVKARADIEAAVLDAAQHHGVEVGAVGPGWMGQPAALEASETDESDT